MRRALVAVAVVLISGCTSKDDKRYDEQLAYLVKYADEGFLPSFADAFFVEDSSLEFTRSSVKGLKASAARKQFRAEAAKLIANKWDRIRASELSAAKNPKNAEPEWVKKKTALMDKLFTALLEADPSLPGKWAELQLECGAVANAAAAESAKAEAEKVKGKTLYFTTGFEDSDLDRCVRDALGVKDDVVSRRGRPAAEVIAAASDVIGVNADMVWNEYVQSGSSQVKARIPKRLTLTVEHRQKSVTVTASLENIDSFRSDVNGSAVGNAYGSAAKLIPVLYGDVCSKLRAQAK
ncbi:MAG: hypothetical protein QM817_31935 [Archangium sp.]